MNSQFPSNLRFALTKVQTKKFPAMLKKHVGKELGNKGKI